MNLSQDINEHILLICHPYQIKNLYYTCKFLYVKNKSLLARVAHKWCWPDKTPFQILTDIPNISFSNIWKASLFYYPLYAVYTDYGMCIDSRSVGKFDPLSIYHQACKVGYSELECEGFLLPILNNPITTDLDNSTMTLMELTLIASKHSHTYILNKLMRSLDSMNGTSVDVNDEVIPVSYVTSVYNHVIGTFANMNIDVREEIDDDTFTNLVMNCFESITSIWVDYPLENLFRIVVNICRNNTVLEVVKEEIISILTTGHMDGTSEYSSLLEIVYASFHLLDRQMFFEEISTYISLNNLTIADKDPYFHNDSVADYPFFCYLPGKMNRNTYIIEGVNDLNIPDMNTGNYII